MVISAIPETWQSHSMSISVPHYLTAQNTRPFILAVGFRRINKMLQALAPSFADRAVVEVLDVGFEQAVAKVHELQASQLIDVVVAAGSNGGYLRQRLDTPVVLVKVGGFDLMQALARARRLSSQVGLVTYEGMAPDLSPFGELFEVGVIQRSYRTEDEALASVQELRQLGITVVVGTGTVADQADALGLAGVFLYSMDAVREALNDAVEVARASRIEWAKRERLNTILAQLSDGVIAVDQQERIETLNPAMAHVLGIVPGQWLGRTLSEVCPELSLQSTLRLAREDLEKIERVKGRALIVNRMPILEQGMLTGAVLSCQDPISIQRVDRHIRTRIKPNAVGARHELAEFLGESPAAQRVRTMALNCARSPATVLLVGESGTGKELIAQGIHLASERRELPFVAFNCAAVTETLLESELFGYEEGAFTGARRGGKLGLFEAAHKGTIFLDEVGEMPLSLQARLLRVLQEREVLRVGATEPTPVNVRVIAATHRDLKDLVAGGSFRLDLFYRLNILRLEVPPLRERRQDIGLIAQALQTKLGHQLKLRSEFEPFLSELIEQSQHYDWPGNVRELENIIERLMVHGADFSEGDDQMHQLLQATAPELFMAKPSKLDVSKAADTPLKRRQLQLERVNIAEVLAQCAGDRTAAAQRLGISRTTLWRKLKEKG